MASEMVELLTFLWEKAWALLAAPYTVASLAGVAAAFLLTVVAGRWTRQTWRSAMRQGLFTDATYNAFYISGAFYFLVGGPLFGTIDRAVIRYAPSLHLDLGRHVHPVFQFVLLTLSIDLVGYWWHRMAHAVPFFWEFHKIHHSQTMLTPLTNFRFHPLDVAVRSLMMMVPLFIFGAVREVWLIVVFLELALNGMAHSNLAWSYGWLGRLFVSPQFHRIHHSTEPQHFGRNFGQQYSLWDLVFGTAITTDEAPRAYGVAGDPVPAGFLAQQFSPLFGLLRLRRETKTVPVTTAPAPKSA